MKWIGKFILGLIFTATLLLIPGLVQSAPPVTEEYAVKGAFIYNFTKFIEWPEEAFASADSPFIIGVLGRNPFGDSLHALHGKKVKGRPIHVQQFTSLGQAKQSHILFIAASEKYRQKGICRALQGPILTVSDTGGFLEAGGGINLVTVEKKIRFGINLDAFHHAKLTVSSQLLKLAIIVKPETKDG